MANCRDHDLTAKNSSVCTRATHINVSSSKFSARINSNFMSLRKLSDRELCITEEKIGQGVFGVCYIGSLGPLKICAKVFRSACLCESSFRYEAVLLSMCTHANIPWFYGIVKSPRMIISSFHAINGKACTLHRILNSRTCTIEQKISPVNWKTILLGMASAVQYIHAKEILHNDIKSDNIILECRQSDSFHSILIDFGKGCFITDARMYNLTEDQKQIYVNEHPQVAPEIHEGQAKQSVHSDMYSLGRVINQVNEKNCVHTVNCVPKEPILTGLLHHKCMISCHL